MAKVIITATTHSFGEHTPLHIDDMTSPSVEDAIKLIKVQAEIEHKEYENTNAHFSVRVDGSCQFYCNTDPASSAFYKEIF